MHLEQVYEYWNDESICKFHNYITLYRSCRMLISKFMESMEIQTNLRFQAVEFFLALYEMMSHKLQSVEKAFTKS